MEAIELTSQPNITKLNEWLSHQQEAQQMFEQARRVLGERLVQFQSEGAIPELEEPGWQRVGTDGKKIGNYTRQEINNMAWHYFRNDPMYKHAVNLHNSYTFGRGVTIKANDDRLQEIIDGFWNDQLNRDVISRPKALYARNAERINNGEQFWMLFVSKQTGAVRVRPLDPREIQNVIYHNDDPTRPREYQRVFTPRRFDRDAGRYVTGKETKLYLPDFRWAGAGPEIHAETQRILGLPATTEVYLLHDLSDSFEGRGLSLFSTSIPWLRAFKGFMEDRVTMQIAAALFAFKGKIAGNKAAVDRVLSQFDNYETANRYGADQWRDRRQGANIWAENEAMNLEQFRFDTGAGNAYTDGRMLRQMVGVGAGLFEHYLAGDAATGNLATATAMELPMLKTFEYEQQYWRDLLGDLMWFVTVKAVEYGAGKSLARLSVDTALGTWHLEPSGTIDLDVDIEFPDIVQRDSNMLLSSIGAIASAETMLGERLVSQRRKALTVYSALGVDNPTSEVDDMLETNPTVTGSPPQALTESIQGRPLPPQTALEMSPITQAEIDRTISMLRKLPPLEEIMRQFNLTDKDVEV